MVFVIEIILTLILLVVAAEIITNGFEHLGKKLSLSEGTTGSVFAAVATALPESTIPIIAVFGPSNDNSNHVDIGIGAVIGAPLMLSTIAMFVLAISVLNQRGLKGTIKPEISGFNRDIHFFIVAYLLVILSLFINQDKAHILIATALVALYIFYLYKTFSSSKNLVKDGHGTEATSALFLNRVFKGKTTLWTIITQLIAGMVLMIVSAKFFIQGIEHTAMLIGIPSLLLALIIVPVATELPEKLNSVIWVRKNKDTLGFGNITGAMVFQGTLLPAMIMVATDWGPTPLVTYAVVITLIAALWLKIIMNKTSGAMVYLLLCNGFMYVGYGFLVALYTQIE